MLITNFASGELSKNLNGRIDIQQYYQGAARIENFEIIPTGGIKRRCGTQRIAKLSGNNRIIPFIVDKNSIYVLELGLNQDYVQPEDRTELTPTADQYTKPGVINIWKKGVSGNYSVIQILYTDYESLAVIKEVHYAQNYDTLIFVHKDYKPYILQKIGNAFTASEMQFDFIPDIELDDDFDYVMVPDGDLPTKETTSDGHGRFTYNKNIGGVATLFTKDFKAGIDDFWCTKDGKLYKWNVSRWIPYGTDPEIDTDLFSESNKYPSCVAFFNNRLFFASTGEKPQMVWASAAPDNYGTRYNDFSTYKKFVTVNKVTKDADVHIFTCDLQASNIDTVNHRITFTNVTQNFTIEGTLKADVTDYYVSSEILPVGTKVVDVTINTLTVNTDEASVVWDEGETEKKNLVMTIQLWRSVDSVTSEDYEYAVVASNITTADCSLFFELASDQNDAIKFLSSNAFLAVGTESSIWSVAAGITALNISAMMQGRYGSDDLQAQAVETATVYFAQGKKGIREFYYDGESSAFRTNNIALLADHILRESAVSDFDYMTNPYSRLVIVREDGIVAAMLYDKTNGIMAWNRLIHGKGLIKNCAVTRGTDENDFVFFVVKDGDNYFLELLDYGSAMFLDSWKEYSVNVEADYTSGAKLWNKTKNTLCDYDDIPQDFMDAGDEVYIGYIYNSYIKSMPVVAGELSAKKRIVQLYVRFVDSYMPVVKIPGLDDEKFLSVKDFPYSGISKVNYPGVTDRDVCFEMEADGVNPVNILSVEAQLA